MASFRPGEAGDPALNPISYGTPEPEPAVDWQAMYCRSVNENAKLASELLISRIGRTVAMDDLADRVSNINTLRAELATEREEHHRTQSRYDNILRDNNALRTERDDICNALDFDVFNDKDYTVAETARALKCELATAKERNAQLARELEETTGTMDHYRKRAIKAEHNEAALRKQYEGGATVKPRVGEPKSPFEGMQIGTTAPQPTVYPVDADTPDFPALCPACSSLTVRKVAATLMCDDCAFVTPTEPSSDEYKAKLLAFRAANAERERQITEARFGAEGDKQ